MCGRYILKHAPQDVPDNIPPDWSEPLSTPKFEPRYNIAPTQLVPVLRLIDDQPVWSSIKWGFQPRWLKDRYQINARSETVFDKPMFRSSARSKRCLVLASGWYEWQKTDAGKLPWAFELPNNANFAFAGIWTNNDDEENFAILTQPAEPELATIHHRMPCVLTAQGCKTWLDLDIDTLATEKDFVSYKISKRVNNPKNEGPELLQAQD